MGDFLNWREMPPPPPTPPTPPPTPTPTPRPPDPVWISPASIMNSKAWTLEKQSLEDKVRGLEAQLAEAEAMVKDYQRIQDERRDRDEQVVAEITADDTGLYVTHLKSGKRYQVVQFDPPQVKQQTFDWAKYVSMCRFPYRMSHASYRAAIKATMARHTGATSTAGCRKQGACFRSADMMCTSTCVVRIRVSAETRGSELFEDEPDGQPRPCDHPIRWYHRLAAWVHAQYDRIDPQRHGSLPMWMCEAWERVACQFPCWKCESDRVREYGVTTATDAAALERIRQSLIARRALTDRPEGSRWVNPPFDPDAGSFGFRTNSPEIEPGDPFAFDEDDDAEPLF